MNYQALFLLFLISLSQPLFSQNVGIGTTAPLEKFHVAGNMRGDTLKANILRMSSGAGADKILASDASGNASWQSISALNGNAGFGVWGEGAINQNLSNYQPMSETVSGAFAYGHQVTLSGNFAAVSDSREKVNGNADQGAVYIYRLNGNQWQFFQKLVDPEGAASDLFGAAISMSGTKLVVGSPQDDVDVYANKGSATVYTYTGSTWARLQKITDANGDGDDRFGSSVSVSGNMIAIGAPWDDLSLALADRGSVNFYRLNGTLYSLLNKVNDTESGNGDRFGHAVSLSGDHAVVGAPYDDGSFTNQGSTTVFKYNGSNAFVKIGQKIIDNSATENARFGEAVANDGSFITIGAPGSADGKLETYRYVSSDFEQVQILYAPGAATGSFFGAYLFCNSSFLMAGWPNAFVNGVPYQGQTILYTRVGNYWIVRQIITDPGGAVNHRFGATVCIDDDNRRFVIGATASLSSGAPQMVVFGKVN